MLGKKNKRMGTNALYTIWRYKAPIFKLYKKNVDCYQYHKTPPQSKSKNFDE
jgi:hypothetical protein